MIGTGIFRPRTLRIASACIFSLPALGQTQEQPQPEEELAKQLSNPVADLVSIPLQFNWENDVGSDEELRFVLNFQPVVPFSLSENWNFIGRLILPIVSQPALTPGGEAEFGTSDIVLSGFFSPTGSGGPIWGVGPVFGLPTTTDPVLGTGKWQVGPTAVVLKQTGPWTYGALVNHLWSFADTGDIERDDVSKSFVQPFLAFTTGTAVTYSINAESTYDWEVESGEKWTAPINVSISKVTRLGPFPFSIAGGGGYFVAHPEIGPEWKLRSVFTLILPRGK